jgi:hypothetical protein
MSKNGWARGSSTFPPVFAVMHNDRDRHNSGVSVELTGRIIFFDAHLRVMGGVHCGSLACLRMRALVSALK